MWDEELELLFEIDGLAGVGGGGAAAGAGTDDPLRTAFTHKCRQINWLDKYTHTHTLSASEFRCIQKNNCA